MKKKQKKLIETGVANIQTTFNNIIITITDTIGNTLCWESAGTSGFKGAKKKTSFAAQTVTHNAAVKAYEFNLKKFHIILKGRGNGREVSIRTLKALGFIILSVEDHTNIPHNGCRPPKLRRK